MGEENLKISPEIARAEVQKILDYYMIDIDDMEEGDRKSGVKLAVEKLVRGVRAGLIEVKTDEKIKVIQMLRSGDTLTYPEIGGDAKMSMDGISSDRQYQRMYTLLGYMTGVGTNGIKKLGGIDNGLAESLGTLFLLCV